MSDDLGLQKPDPKLFSHVLHTAGVSPAATVMLGDRLDYDVRPAKAAGMHAVWVLRGEAPDEGRHEVGGGQRHGGATAVSSDRRRDPRRPRRCGARRARAEGPASS